MRARAALIVSGIQVELREVALRDKPADLLTASPKGSVPILVVPGDSKQSYVLDESWDIMLWALRQQDPRAWLGQNESLVKTAWSWVAENDGAFKYYLDRYKYSDRFPEQPQSEYRAACETFLARIELNLSSTTNLLGDRFTLADAALLPFARQFAAVDADWFATAPYPHLRSWLTRFTESDLFSRLMRIVPLWQHGDEPVVFGGGE